MEGKHMEYFWSRRESSQTCFFKILLGNFKLHLSIPEMFVVNCKEELPETVILRDSSETTWRVGLKRVNDTLRFEDGWPNFIQDNSLQQTDFLVFGYAEDSCFDVLMFDMTGCEKENSHSVKRKLSPSQFHCECKVRADDKNDRTNSSKKTRVGVDSKLPKQNIGLDSGQSEGNNPDDTNSSWDTDKDDHTALLQYVNKKPTYPLYFISRRRPVTEYEKTQALMSARAHAITLNKPRFIQVMKQTHVYKRFHLAIPIDWAKQHFTYKSQDITLRVSTSGKSWACRVRCLPTGAALEKGWSTFVMDNNLEEGDTCLFVLSQGREGYGCVIMDVFIFHVVDEVVPLTKFIRPRARRDADSKINMADIGSDTDTDTDGAEDTGSNYSKGSPRNALPSYVDADLTYSCYFLSSRRAVTEAEKHRVLMGVMAVKLTKPGFLRAMKQTNVYRGFRLGIPIKWAREFLPKKSQDVILCVPGSEKKWLAELHFRKAGATLEMGWSLFVMDNNLEEGDVCLFQLAQGGKECNATITLDVSIFRVVEEVKPLTKFFPPRC